MTAKAAATAAAILVMDSLSAKRARSCSVHDDLDCSSQNLPCWGVEREESAAVVERRAAVDDGDAAARVQCLLRKPCDRPHLERRPDDEQERRLAREPRGSLDLGLWHRLPEHDHVGLEDRATRGTGRRPRPLDEANDLIE